MLGERVKRLRDGEVLIGDGGDGWWLVTDDDGGGGGCGWLAMDIPTMVVFSRERER